MRVSGLPSHQGKWSVIRVVSGRSLIKGSTAQPTQFTGP